MCVCMAYHLDLHTAARCSTTAPQKKKISRKQNEKIRRMRDTNKHPTRESRESQETGLDWARKTPESTQQRQESINQRTTAAGSGGGCCCYHTPATVTIQSTLPFFSLLLALCSTSLPIAPAVSLCRVRRTHTQTSTDWGKTQHNTTQQTHKRAQSCNAARSSRHPQRQQRRRQQQQQR